MRLRRPCPRSPRHLVPRWRRQRCSCRWPQVRSLMASASIRRLSRWQEPPRPAPLRAPPAAWGARPLWAAPGRRPPLAGHLRSPLRRRLSGVRPAARSPGPPPRRCMLRPRRWPSTPAPCAARSRAACGFLLRFARCRPARPRPPPPLPPVECPQASIIKKNTSGSTSKEIFSTKRLDHRRHLAWPLTRSREEASQPKEPARELGWRLPRWPSTAPAPRMSGFLVCGLRPEGAEGGPGGARRRQGGLMK
mmetsp:Transcript_37558/g.97506  ORF Transcript_37558/g.97506 Transcript_37558/m.97506 type:complete len:249 (+) Transcript_37558:474-1220(+)